VTKRKTPEVVPAHVKEWATFENRLAQIEDNTQRERNDAIADLLSGQEPEEAQAVRGGKASGKSRRGGDAKRNLILQEAASYEGSDKAQVASIVRLIKRKHSITVSDRYVREVLRERKSEP
jgi:hypothetical protein